MPSQRLRGEKWYQVFALSFLGLVEPKHRRNRIQKYNIFDSNCRWFSTVLSLESCLYKSSWRSCPVRIDTSSSNNANAGRRPTNADARDQACTTKDRFVHKLRGISTTYKHLGKIVYYLRDSKTAACVGGGSLLFPCQGSELPWELLTVLYCMCEHITLFVFNSCTLRGQWIKGPW